MADDGWICACGHNKSQHRSEWNGFRGEWNTSCRAEHWGVSGRETCRCAAFISKEDAEAAVASAKAAHDAARSHMVCSCTHHVDEHYWSPSGWTQGVCHFTEHGDYPTCGCREYDGPELEELAHAQ